MRDVQELLNEKENELARIQREIQSLQMILPLLADDAPGDSSASSAAPPNVPPDKKPPETTSDVISQAQATGTDGQTEAESKLWGFTKRWRNK